MPLPAKFFEKQKSVTVTIPWALAAVFKANDPKGRKRPSAFIKECVGHYAMMTGWTSEHPPTEKETRPPPTPVRKSPSPPRPYRGGPHSRKIKAGAGRSASPFWCVPIHVAQQYDAYLNEYPDVVMDLYEDGSTSPTYFGASWKGMYKVEQRLSNKDHVVLFCPREELS